MRLFASLSLLKQPDLVRLCSSTTRNPVIGVTNALKTEYRGQCLVNGWIKSARHQKNVSFINLIDGLTHRHLQVVISADQRGDVSQVRSGASLSAVGELIDSPAKGQAVELAASELKLLGENDDTFPFAVNTTSYDAEYARSFLHLRAKKMEFAAMLRLRSACKKAIHDYFHRNDYIQVDTPVLTSNDCEGAGETFSVERSDESEKTEPFFGRNKKVNLTVSGQLHLEAVNSGISKVYTFSPAFRADHSIDRTHLAEFYMLEGEVAFADNLDQLLEIAEDFTRTITYEMLTQEEDTISALHSGTTRYEVIDHKEMLSRPFGRLTYTDAIKLLQDTSVKFERKPVWGKDLRREHEHMIIEAHGNRPVFVTDWPKSLKPFYMYENDDERTVAAMDMLVPGPGELFGGSVREWRYGKLEQTLNDKQMLPSYEWYLDLRKYGSVPHAGFGMGFERLLQFIFGVKQIRDTIAFPRYTKNCRL